MSNSGVLVVLSNYARPSHLPACIAAWKGQSVPPACLVVVDNSPCPVDESLPERYPNPLFEGADDVWRFRRNLGCPARFAPALAMSHQYEYVIFADDDLLPGRKAIEACLEVAKSLNNRFASIGQIGRTINTSRPAGSRYVCGNAKTYPAVDLTCRCYMVRTSRLPSMLEFRWSLARRCREKEDNASLNLLDIHDDMLMCLGIQWCAGLPSYLIPTSSDPQRQLILRNLPEGKEGVWRRPTHFAERNQMVELALETGWQPIRQ